MSNLIALSSMDGNERRSVYLETESYDGEITSEYDPRIDKVLMGLGSCGSHLDVMNALMKEDWVLEASDAPFGDGEFTPFYRHWDCEINNRFLFWVVFDNRPMFMSNDMIPFFTEFHEIDGVPLMLIDIAAGCYIEPGDFMPSVSFSEPIPPLTELPEPGEESEILPLPGSVSEFNGMRRVSDMTVYVPDIFERYVPEIKGYNVTVFAL